METSEQKNQPLVHVIDDEPGIRTFIQEVAELKGFHCVEAESLDELKSVYCPKALVLFVDLMLGSSDGIEVLRYLADQGYKGQVVPMSGYDRRTLNTAQELALSLGLRVAGYLEKPIRLPDLEKYLSNQPELELSAERRAVYVPQTEELYQAIKHEEFVVHYQPQLEVQTGRVFGVEALVRWEHPDLGLLFPDSFIGTLEGERLIDEVTWLVLKQALNDYQRFMQEGLDLEAVSINMSAVTLTDLTLPDKLKATVDRHGVPPAHVVIEVTESGLIWNFSNMLDVLARLRLKGLRLSIDDFGSGYSMMQQLRRVPAKELKIDKSFVQAMDRKDSYVILCKTIELAHELDMQVVAEGVETEEQWSELKKLGCDGMQGFLFSKPLAPRKLTEWYKNRPDIV